MIQETERLTRALGYEFADRGLLTQALTHCSAGGKNNERLEFLGDGALNFVIAAALFERFPDAPEGILSRLRARLVKRETLAVVARTLALGDYLHLGSGELKSGGYRRESILADAMEAVFGAIFLDGGFDACGRVVLALYGEHLERLDPENDLKDPKTRLQEYLQARRVPLPRYEVEEVSGADHDQLFKVHCYVEGFDHPIYGEGNSRRRAEQSAARVALEQLEMRK